MIKQKIGIMLVMFLLILTPISAKLCNPTNNTCWELFENRAELTIGRFPFLRAYESSEDTMLVNPDGYNIDFKANALGGKSLLWDAEKGYLGIGSDPNTPKSELHVIGTGLFEGNLDRENVWIGSSVAPEEKGVSLEYITSLDRARLMSIHQGTSRKPLEIFASSIVTNLVGSFTIDKELIVQDDIFVNGSVKVEADDGEIVTCGAYYQEATEDYEWRCI